MNQAHILDKFDPYKDKKASSFQNIFIALWPDRVCESCQQGLIWSSMLALDGNYGMASYDVQLSNRQDKTTFQRKV